MPEMFGTHHSKMLVLLRHDDTAQVIIHTANMISRDWTNMTQAIWRSPLLPLLPPSRSGSQDSSLRGTGERFKEDLLNYLRAYDTRRVTCRPLIEALTKYDFSAIRATLIASVPGRYKISENQGIRWGWAALRETLRSVPVKDGSSEVVVQISSIATLGANDTWLQKTMFDSLSQSKSPVTQRPTFKVVFPTPDEIRRSLDGYDSGGSIHTKIQSAQQVKQLQYLRPMFCHWANDAQNGRGTIVSLPD
jgi:tyrosyl-DNA phosphodiesterase-1